MDAVARFDRAKLAEQAAAAATRGVGPMLDRALSVVFPGWAKRRQAARIGMAQDHARMSALAGVYKGARRDRANDDWTPQSVSADAALLQDHRELRDRSRELTRDDPIAAAITRTICDNVVGSGIRPQSRLDARALGITQEQADAWQELAEAEWNRAVPYLDVTMRTDAYGLQKLAVRQLIENGEAFAIPRFTSQLNRPFETCVDMVESDRVDTPDEKLSDRAVRNGVVLGRDNQPVGYWIADQHPGDWLIDPQASVLTWRRVRAWDETGRRRVIHLYQPKRPGQTRGEPLFAPVLSALRDLSEYVESERIAARVNSCISLWITQEDPGIGVEAHTDEITAQGDRLEKMRAGIIQRLRPGERIEPFNANRPGVTFEPYVVALVRQIGAGIGLPLELVLLDFSRTNYSSARAAILEARRFFTQFQRLVMERFCQPLWAAVLEEAWLKGRLPGAEDFIVNRDLWTAADWIAPGWGWVDPVKEIQASTLAVDGNLSTLAEECASQGRDWQAVMRQRRRERELAAELGLMPQPAATPVVATVNGQPVQAQPADEESEEPVPA
jgi:lambda family phage portal protein